LSTSRRRYDAIVVGGGPAGAVMGWALARRGIRAVILDRAHFPREKVCGDFVEPRGLRLFREMGCLRAIEATHPLPITHTSLYLGSTLAYRGAIPFYGAHPTLPPHGYIVAREELDARLLHAAARAGAEVREGCPVERVERRGARMTVHVRGRRSETLSAPFVVGADGTQSTVARSMGLFEHDPRYVAIAQRAYVAPVSLERGEAAFFFDRDLFPGYGWMFPMSGGRANVGVGVLAEAVARYRINVPQLLDAFVERLRRAHPACARIRLVSKPIGGIVRTYGAAGPNHFDGGILIGDAGCFVDPMTGEGITPAGESAMLGAGVLAQALEAGRTDRAFLARYERAFRAYFDPAMRYLDFCACVMRNRHLSEFWIRAVTRGCALAADDPEFARVSGGTFGGLDVRPLAIATQVWTKGAARFYGEGLRIAAELLSGRTDGLREAISDTYLAQAGWWASWADDPRWHAAWVGDVGRKGIELLRTAAQPDPRTDGPAPLDGQLESARVLRTRRSSSSGRRVTRRASASASAAKPSR
jgi:geranylgeranyl reductase family protein